MKSLKKDLLIPFDLHIEEKCGSCHKNKREFFKRADALIYKDGLEFISLKSYSTFMHEHLNRLRDMSINSQTAEDYSFYASHAKVMVNDWILFDENIMNMASDSRYSTIKNDLIQAWENVNTELRGLVSHFISAHETLLQMGAPAPSVRILLKYRDSHKADDNE